MFDKMSKEHVKEVIDIFNYYVENSFSAYPEDKLPYEFYNKFLEMINDYPAFVIRRKNIEKIIGFCFLTQYNPFPVFRKTAKITYFLDKDELGKRLGKQVLEKLEKEAKKRGIKILLADISSENFMSIKFHQKNGFQECGRFHNIGYKNDKNFDVIWLEKKL
jgi:phosphinothricin acetyltransferase